MQSWDGLHPRSSRNQLFYAESDDLRTWTAPQPLAAELTRDRRAIDAALAQHDNHWYLMYKEGQTPCLATSTQLDGPWQRLPRPFHCWAENVQLINIDETWHALATLEEHHQGLATMLGDPKDPTSWSHWSPFRLLKTPSAPFNAGMPANASALWDNRSEDGYWYRVFCAHTEKTAHNLGYTLGIARSSDLHDWNSHQVYRINDQQYRTVQI